MHLKARFGIHQICGKEDTLKTRYFRIIQQRQDYWGRSRSNCQRRIHIFWERERQEKRKCLLCASFGLHRKVGNCESCNTRRLEKPICILQVVFLTLNEKSGFPFLKFEQSIGTSWTCPFNRSRAKQITSIKSVMLNTIYRNLRVWWVKRNWKNWSLFTMSVRRSWRSIQSLRKPLMMRIKMSLP